MCIRDSPLWTLSKQKFAQISQSICVACYIRCDLDLWTFDLEKYCHKTIGIAIVNTVFAKYCYWYWVLLTFLWTAHAAARLCGNCKHDTVCVFIVYCPESSGFTYSTEGRRACFKLMTTKTDWESAKNQCPVQHQQAHLVVIKDVKKQKAVKEFIQGEDITIYRGCFEDTVKLFRWGFLQQRPKYY